MNTAKINLNETNTNRAAYYKRKVKMRFTFKRAETIAWMLFFGIGVAYFIATLIMTK
jgi:hypothetical protein